MFLFMADKSVNAEQSTAMEELIQRMCSRLDDKLDDTVAQINQSVDLSHRHTETTTVLYPIVDWHQPA